MQNQPHSSQGGGLGLDDVYYALFRHKWKIIILFLGGILAAGVIYRLKPPDYQSDAELFIRYVAESASPSPDSSETRVPVTEATPENAINSEIQVLMSLDVAKQAAEIIGPDKILGKGGGNDAVMAAAFIKNHLKVSPLPRSSVLQLEFKHPDPELVQPVLNQIIEQYFKKYQEVHMAAGMFNEFVRKEIDQLKGELEETETQLRKTRNEAGVVTPTEDAMKAFSESISRTRQVIRDAEAELADRQAAYDEMKKLSSGKPETAASTNASPATAPEPVMPETATQEYNQVTKRLANLWADNADLLTKWSPESNAVKDNRDLIDKAQKEKQELETKYPGLKQDNMRNLFAQPTAQLDQHQPNDMSANLSIERVKIAGLTNKIATLYKQLDEIKTAEGRIAEVAPHVLELEHKKELQLADLQFFSKSLEQSHIQEGLGAGRVLNIKEIQEPSPPVRDWSKRYKAMEMLVAGGLFGGIGLAFLIELYLDGSVRRPKEVKTKLGLPLLLSIPNVVTSGSRRKALGAGPASAQNINGDAAAVIPEGLPPATGPLEVAPWDHNHSLHPFYEALRDRLIGHFEVRNLTHNPKLVGMAGCSKGSGATTLAMGLAASLSETGEGNVLLVDMNQEQGAAQHFYMGRPHCGLDELLENGSGNRDGALVQDKLYVVSGNSNGDKLPRILPKRFASLLPKLKASDYDYIIFDMPPVGPTSVTLRLAGFMDTMLLVAESEKTNRNAVTEAASLLAEAKASVAVVLNKTRSYIPASLDQGS